MYENYILRGMRHQQASEAGAQKAFDGEHTSEVMKAILQHEPDWSGCIVVPNMDET